MLNDDVVLMVSYPASGKSTIAQQYKMAGYAILSRDERGGFTDDIIDFLEIYLAENKKIVVDCTFATIKSRESFINSVHKFRKTIGCHFIDISADDALINSLHRMFERYDKIYMHQNDFPFTNDPNGYMLSAIFNYQS